MKIAEEVTYEKVPVFGHPEADEFVPVGRKVVVLEDALTVTLLVESEAFKRGCSGRLLGLPSAGHTSDDVYVVCDVLQHQPTLDQLGDLARRLSNFLEDVHRRNVDCRFDPLGALGALSSPLSIPIVHRAKLKVALAARDRALAGHRAGAPWPLEPCKVEERESFCAAYLSIPKWTEPVRAEFGHIKVTGRHVLTRAEQVAELDAIAVRHGLRCVEHGELPD